MSGTATSFSAFDHAHMAQALRLAERGRYTTRPNPVVGCVIAQGETVVGEGWHQRAGEAHAEVHALRAAAETARGATAYVTLEPCGLHGRTPPCADALIRAGIARVVVAAADHSQRAGAGLQRLRDAGIRIDSGLMEAAAREQNRGFFSRIERGRPWLRIKLAMSLDGRTALASGESVWISGAAARRDVQRWRARSCALLTGMGTVLADDPRLSLRPDEGAPSEAPQPRRVLIDSTGRLPGGRRIAQSQDDSLLRLHADDITPQAQPGVDDLAIARSAGGLDLHAVLAALAARGINEVQAEAGATLSGALLNAGLVDELLLYVAPVLLGERGRPLLASIDPANMADRLSLTCIETRRIGEDIRLLLRPVKSGAE
jgi:diaminohydroxyphosphoribosylaminopyrimidine deaminase/5-amino-6-(5-phosphoribosylamino)uracil reductase